MIFCSFSFFTKYNLYASSSVEKSSISSSTFSLGSSFIFSLGSSFIFSFSIFSSLLGFIQHFQS